MVLAGLESAAVQAAQQSSNRTPTTTEECREQDDQIQGYLGIEMKA